MRLKDTPENRVTAAITLATCDRVDWMRNDIGCADYGTSRVQYGVGGRGGSDYLGIVRPPHKHAGKLFAREDKANKPDVAAIDARIASSDYCPGSCKHERCRLVYQRLFHIRVKRCGGLACFADCVEDILKELST